jgi:hypothetical protein
VGDMVAVTGGCVGTGGGEGVPDATGVPDMAQPVTRAAVTTSSMTMQIERFMSNSRATFCYLSRRGHHSRSARLPPVDVPDLRARTSCQKAPLCSATLVVGTLSPRPSPGDRRSPLGEGESRTAWPSSMDEGREFACRQVIHAPGLRGGSFGTHLGNFC